jgi:hypothetical protein
MAKKKTIATKSAKRSGQAKKKVQKEVSNNELSEQIEAGNKNLAKQIKLTNDRIEEVNTDLSGQIRNVTEQVEVVAMAVANVQNRLAEINTKMIGMNQKIIGLGNRFDDIASTRAKSDEVHKRFLRIEKEIGLTRK